MCMHIGSNGLVSSLFMISVFTSYHYPAIARPGFGTFSGFAGGCQGFAEPDLSTLLNKNQTPSIGKECMIQLTNIGIIFKKANP